MRTANLAHDVNAANPEVVVVEVSLESPDLTAEAAEIAVGAPTVLTGLAGNRRVVREEIFDPVAVVLPSESFDEALALANDTRFGLAAATFTRALGKALVFAREGRAGIVKVNQETGGIEFQAPFGAMGESTSRSSGQGKVARDFFTHWKTVYLISPRQVR